MKKKHKITLIGMAISGATSLFGPSIAEFTKDVLAKPKQEQTKVCPEPEHKKVTYSISVTREVEN